MKTAAHQVRLDAIHAMPCIACESEKAQQPSRTEAHHLVDKGYRKHSGGDDATIPLCGWHHRGDIKLGYTGLQMRERHGPSLKSHKPAFIQKYGTERALLDRVDFQLRKTGVIAA